MSSRISPSSQDSLFTRTVSRSSPRSFSAPINLLVIGMLMAQPYAGAFAASVSAQTSVAAYDMNDNWLTDICFNYSGSGALTQCQGSYSYYGTNNPGSDLNYIATAAADYGVLSVYGASSTSKPGSAGSPEFLEPEYITTRGTASFRDQWTITGGTNGTTGTLQLSFDVTGSYFSGMVDTGLSFGLSLFNFTTGVYASHNQLPNYTGVLTTQFTYGTPIDFIVSLLGGSTMWSLSEGGYDGQNSYIDMSHTALMNAIVVKDGNGNAVPFNMSTSSGAALFDDLAPAAVPLPAAFYLLVAGLMSLIGLARRSS